MTKKEKDFLHFTTRTFLLDELTCNEAQLKDLNRLLVTQPILLKRTNSLAWTN